MIECGQTEAGETLQLLVLLPPIVNVELVQSLLVQQ